MWCVSQIVVPCGTILAQLTIRDRDGTQHEMKAFGYSTNSASDAFCSGENPCCISPRENCQKNRCMLSAGRSYTSAECA